MQNVDEDLDRLMSCMLILIARGIDQPGKVANSAHGQLNRKHEYFSVPVRA